MIFGKIEIDSPYLWMNGHTSKPLIDQMQLTHQGRSDAVSRALVDFGIEESFGQAANRFEEHYKYEISPSTVSRETHMIAEASYEYVTQKLSIADKTRTRSTDVMLIELDGCEIRTAVSEVVENSSEKTAVYANPKKKKRINWRDVRMGFARPLGAVSKIYIGKKDTYPEVVSDLYNASLLSGMVPGKTKVVGVADGGIGLKEELERQFPDMQFILDKIHLKDHLFDTAEALGVIKKDRGEWVYSRLEKISRGEVDQVKENFEKEYEKNPDDRLRRLIGYITRFYDSLNYGEFKAKGYPIGSGEIESTHRSIPQKRLKLPGASWHPSSINPMLSLRILRANDWWEDFWKERTARRMAA